jgi:hypothetical protein
VPFGIDGREGMEAGGVAKGDSHGSVADRSEEREEKGQNCCKGMVSEAQSSGRNRKVGKLKCKGGEGGWRANE